VSVDGSSTRSIQLTHGKVALVDASDYDLMSAFPWRAVRIRHTWYAPLLLGGAEEFMHRLILAVGPGQRVDHRNGKGLDNRRCNLRLVTNALNQANRRQVRSASGFKGVTWRNGKWRAYITVGQRSISLGSFATPEEAARAS
jgi:hypothetical protein